MSYLPRGDRHTLGSSSRQAVATSGCGQGETWMIYWCRRHLHCAVANLESGPIELHFDSSTSILIACD